MGAMNPFPDTGAGTPLTEQQEFDQHMAFTCDCTSWREHQDRVFDALDAARSRPATDLCRAAPKSPYADGVLACGMYAGHPTGEMDEGHHFVRVELLPVSRPATDPAGLDVEASRGDHELWPGEGD